MTDGPTGPNLHPLTDPNERGRLDVGDGHVIAWAEFGNPAGQPVVALHGGPGSGSSVVATRFFDPDRFRVILFDQRGSGESTPSASSSSTDMSTITTHHLAADIERLRRARNVDRWLVFGSSWGATLGLIYAEAHPSRVAAMLLTSVTMTRRDEIDWLYRGVGALLPAEFAEFRAAAGSPPDANLVDTYRRLLESPDPHVRIDAARAWCAWEDAVVMQGQSIGPDPRYDEDDFVYGFARTVTHFFAHDAWLEDDHILAEAHQLDGIPGVLVHATDDLASRIETPRQLAAVWRTAELVEVDAGGHSLTQGAMAPEILSAVDRLADRI